MRNINASWLLTACFALTACAGDSDDASGADDEVPDVCDGTADRFVYVGAVEADHVDFGFTTVNGKIVGTGGAAQNRDLIAFTLRDPATYDLESLGDHDVALQNITALRAPLGATCETGNTQCRGFFALAGTYTVLEVHPRYRATFEISDLYERTDNFGPPGAAIEGTIRGCIDKTNP
jgi:hypothetical protein